MLSFKLESSNLTQFHYLIEEFVVMEETNSETKSADQPAFKDRYVSNFFDGADKFAFLKAVAPMEALVGIGVLAATFLPRFLGISLGALLLLPPTVRVVLRSLGISRNPDMESIVRGRVTAKLDGDFCILLIGARNNAPWKLTNKFKTVGTAFQSMFKELESLPMESSGYMGAEMFFSGNFLRSSHTLAVVYWRSYDHLIKFAHNPNLNHVAAWRAADKECRESADIGIWHEAFQVVGGKYDGIYVNCPPIGLGMVNPLVPCDGHLRTSRGRTGTPNKPGNSDESSSPLPESH